MFDFIIRPLDTSLSTQSYKKLGYCKCNLELGLACPFVRASLE